MVMYRRVFQKGGVYFFTVTLKNRKQNLLTDYYPLLKTSIEKTKQKYPFKIIAHVTLPEHIHCIWQLPENDCNYSRRWQMIKASFVKELIANHFPVKFTKKREANIWARRFWEHVIRDEYDLEKHIEYIHYNPVKHGLCDSPSQWPHSSIQAYIKKGIIPHDWGSTEINEDTRFNHGE